MLGGHWGTVCTAERHREIEQTFGEGQRHAVLVPGPGSGGQLLLFLRALPFPAALLMVLTYFLFLKMP